MASRRLFAALVTFWLTSAGCGSSSPTIPTTAQSVSAAPTLQTILFSADFSALTTAGATTQLTATGIFSNRTTQDLTAACTDWQSDNASVLAVNMTGLLTAQSSGNATVTALCDGLLASDQIAVMSTVSTPTDPTFRVGATCNDGWVSTATGSGACSDHGGVACWRYNDGTCRIV